MSHPILTLTAVVAVAAFLGCKDEPFSPDRVPQPDPDDPVILQSGLNAYLVVSGASELVGSVVTVEAKIKSTEQEQTPTAFVASLHFDRSRLEFLESVSLDDGVLRVANPEAASGAAKVAGAAADGLDTDILFVARMQVLDEHYLQGLRLELHELGILEQGFADVAAETHVSANVITSNSMVVWNP